MQRPGRCWSAQTRIAYPSRNVRTLAGFGSNSALSEGPFRASHSASFQVRCSMMTKVNLRVVRYSIKRIVSKATGGHWIDLDLLKNEMGS